MTRFLRTDSNHTDFIHLVNHLDADLAIRDGDDHDFYHQFNGISLLNHVIIIYKDHKAVGCGALKEYKFNVMEVKRMYVLPEYRGCGYASKILNELETWALELEYTKCILETGIQQPEAIALYQKNNYKRIENYSPYEGVEKSFCFEKKLN